MGPSTLVLAGVIMASFGLHTADTGATQTAHEDHDAHHDHADHDGHEEHEAHVHGVGHLGVAIEAGGRVEAEFETPGYNLFGFEREPRDADEARAVSEARSSLLAEGVVLRLDRDAGCAYLGGEIADTGYHDIRVTYRFDCAQPQRLRRIGTGVFEVFERFETIEAVLVSPDRQAGFDLTPAAPDHRLAP